jgi:FeS assembly ATPase SufC
LPTKEKHTRPGFLHYHKYSKVWNTPLKYGSLLHVITPHRSTLLLILLLLLAGSLVSLANPWIAGQLTQSILDGPEAHLPSFQLILLAWFVLLIIRSLLGFASSYLVGSTGERMAARLRSRVYEHLQILPMTYYQDQRPGDLLTLLSRDSETISYFVTNTLVRLLPLTLTFAGAFVIMAWLDPVIALLAAVLMPVYYIAMKLIGRRIRPLSSAWIKSWSGMVSLVQENLGLLPAIKAFTREGLEAQRFEKKNTEYLSVSRKQILIQSIMTPAISLLAGAGLLLLLWVGIQHMQSGQLQTSELVSLLLYAMLLTQPVSGLAGVYGQVMLTRGAADRLLGFFSVQSEPLSAGKPSIGTVRGEIEFRDLSFAYPGRAEVFSNLDLKIEAGETIALTGPNGAGKSTLGNVLAGREGYEVTKGEVIFNGKNLLEMEPEERACEGVFLAFQYPVEIPGVNNTYFLRAALNAQRKYRGEEILDSVGFLRLVREKLEILHIGDGLLHRAVNEGFSGGEKKRNEIFQMAVLEPTLAILDETDSGLDIDALKIVAEGVNRLRSKDRGMIVVTHYQRLLDYIVPDKVHVLADGKLVVTGGPDLALKLEEQGYAWLEDGGIATLGVDSAVQTANP